MHGEARRRFRADALGAVVLSRNLHIHPAAASIKVILNLRVRVLDFPGPDGQIQLRRFFRPRRVRRRALSR